MKEKMLNKAIECVKNKYPDYNQDKLDEIAYGLEGIYLTFTKLIVVFALSLLLGTFKDMILLLLFYNIIRTTAFGMHAKKSIHCLIMSIVMFVCGGVLCKYININYYVKKFMKNLWNFFV